MAVSVGFAAVLSGSTVTSPIGIGNAEKIGIWAPTVTSCQLFVQGAFNQTSANFVRLMEANLTSPRSHFVFPVGPGSLGVMLESVVAAFPFIKLESSLAQTDTRTFGILFKF